jgi:hypothetical protein
MVSTLAISCVFTSVVFLEGPAKFLFTPLGLAVVFAMLASYALSRTLTPVIIGLLLKGEHHHGAAGSGNWFARLHQAFERGFERLRPLECAVQRRRSPVGASPTRQPLTRASMILKLIFPQSKSTPANCQVDNSRQVRSGLPAMPSPRR